MGWNRQSGENWELSRTVMHTDGQHDPVKALRLAVNGILTIDDADDLLLALAQEVVAARKSEEHQVVAARRRQAMSQQGYAAEDPVYRELTDSEEAAEEATWD